MESHDMILLGNRISQEQGNQVIFLLLSLIGGEQEYRMMFQCCFQEWGWCGSQKLGALSLTSWSAVAVCYLGQVCFPLSACLSSCVT